MKDATLIGIFAAEAGEPPPEWHVPLPPDEPAERAAPDPEPKEAPCPTL